MCSPQPARSNSEKIPLSRVKQRRMRTFTFMTAPLLASAAMFITTLSAPSASGTTLNGMVSNRGHVFYTTTPPCPGKAV